MWLMTRYGFFSMVCAAEESVATRHKTPHGSLMMIRARREEHITALVAAYPNILAEASPIQRTDNTDYPVRVFVDRCAVSLLVSALALDIDYCNFKDAVHKHRPKDYDYSDFLVAVWSAGLALSPRSLYGAFTRGLYNYGGKRRGKRKNNTSCVQELDRMRP